MNNDHSADTVDNTQRIVKEVKANDGKQRKLPNMAKFINPSMLKKRNSKLNVIPQNALSQRG